MTKINKEGWKVKKLGEVTTFSRGLTYSGNDEVPASSNVVLRSNNITLESQSLNLDELKYINESIDIPAEKKLAKDTIFMCMSNGSMKHIGKVAYIDKDYEYAFGGFMGLIRPKAEVVFPKYLYFYFCSQEFKRVLTKIANGANINNIKFSDINQERIPLPPLPIQHRIVEELDEINAIISAKKQQLKELDELAQSIFYNMFGDPVNNEKGWEVKKLGEVALLKAGKSIKASELHPQGKGLFPCYGGNGIRGYIAKKSHEGVYPLIGRQGALCGNVNLAQGEFYATEHAVVVSPIMDYEPIWMLYNLKGLNLPSYAGGAAQPGLAVGNIVVIETPLPPLPLQETFAARVSAIEEEKAAITASIEEMQTLLDARMQEYFG